MELILCILFLFPVSFGTALSPDEYIKPSILEQTQLGEIILDNKESYNLTCKGDGPLAWNYPGKSIKGSKTSFEVFNSNYSNEYSSVLTITSITYRYVGYYTCFYVELGDGNDLYRDRLYIYVNDTNNLSVENNYVIHYAIQHQETVIPCRPTTPDITVELDNTSNPGSIESVYNPKIGFTVTFYDIRSQDTYYCTFTRPSDNNQFEQFFFVQIDTRRVSLAKPYIEDASKNHTTVGQDLTLKCFLNEDSPAIDFKFTKPNGEVVDGTQAGTDPILHKILTIEDVTKADSGRYTCTASDKQGNSNTNYIDVFIHDKNSCFIRFPETNDIQNMTIPAHGEFVWAIEVESHPIAKLKWYDNHGKEIMNNTQHSLRRESDTNIILTIFNLSLEDDGDYRIHASNAKGKCKTELNYPLKLNVLRKPESALESQDVYLVNSSAIFTCMSTGNPVPEIKWSYRVCQTDELGNCEVYNTTIGQEQIDTVIEKNKITSHLTLIPQYNGIVECTATNTYGSDRKSAKFYTSDVKDGFDIYNYGEDAIVEEINGVTEVILPANYPLSFTCALSPKKAKDLKIFHNKALINPHYSRYFMDTVNDTLSWKTTVTLNESREADSGVYSCQARSVKTGKLVYKNFTFVIKDVENPHIHVTNLTETLEVEYPKMPIDMYCNYTGIPKVTIEWYKDGKVISENDRIVFENGKRQLKLLSTQVEDEGLYKCVITNDLGTDSRQGKLTIQNKPSTVIGYISIIIVAGVLVVALVTYIIIKMKKERVLKEKLKSLGLENFHKGDPDHLNPDLGIDDQAELLPYDKKWEFPIEQLKLGKQLGSGAFGVVMKAEAKRISAEEEKTIVAVKMVKKNADHSYIKALASELKIMVHLGRHINVVNLLGACTKNVADRELLVIVEFCRYGNLQNYLFKHRESFINQVDPKSGIIDYNIGCDVLNRLYSVSSDSGSVITTPHSMQDYRDSEKNTAMTSAATQITSCGDDQVTLSNNSIQPEWRTNYRGDYKGNVKPVATRDLVAWSFQIARGMEYLASRKVMHGDLAARNILLSDNEVVKICDFGLAKTMYNDNNYKKKGNSPLPIKWMAIESIRDRVFSTQSDAWSFGIVLWELFSLARTPYPGIEADERLYYKLVEGYRMEPPPYSPKQIYAMMEDCWQTKPLSRPTFTQLAQRIGHLLEDSVRKHYVDLNDPYLVMNTKTIDDKDYLEMLSPPSFDLLSTPPSHNYVNDDVMPSSSDLASSKSPEGYTFMGANSIFSPRLQSEVFDFDLGKKKVPNERRGNQELSPMLHSNNESDSESGYLRPISPINSISNPTYHLTPTIPQETSPSKKKEIFKSPDNYITMPQYKNLSNDKLPVHIDASKNNGTAHYVNSDAAMWDSVDV